MKLKYVNKKDDYKEVLKRYVFETAKYKKMKYKSFISLPITLLLIIIPIIIIINDFKLSSYFSVGFIAFYFLSIQKLKNDRKKIEFNYISKIDNKTLLSEKTIEIVNGKIKFSSEIEKYEIGITQVNFISYTNNLIYIVINAQQTIIIPKDGIMDGSFDDFYTKLSNAFDNVNIDTTNKEKHFFYKTTENKHYKKKKNIFEYDKKKRNFFKILKIIIVVVLLIIGITIIISSNNWTYKQTLLITYLISIISYIILGNNIDWIFLKDSKVYLVENYLNDEGLIISDETGKGKMIWNRFNDYEIVKSGIVLRFLNDCIWLPNNSLENETTADVKKFINEKFKKTQ